MGKDSWNTGPGSEKSTSPSTCTERIFPPGEIRVPLTAASCTYTEAALAPAWLCRRLQRGLWPWLSVCCSVSSHEHHDVPLLLTLPFLFPSIYSPDTISVFVLADFFFQYTSKMEFASSGINLIIFCQKLVLKITAAVNYHSSQSSRKTHFSLQERNLSFPFSFKYLKCFILLKWI